MKISKDFKVQEVQVTGNRDLPYKIVIDYSRIGEKKESYLMFDETNCKRLGIDMSLGLIGRTLSCIFESHELPLIPRGDMRGSMDWGKTADDDLMILSLQKNERYNMVFSSPPSKTFHTTRIMELMTPRAGGRMAQLPCPYYHVFLDLTAEQYAACKRAPANLVFSPSFKLV